MLEPYSHSRSGSVQGVPEGGAEEGQGPCSTGLSGTGPSRSGPESPVGAESVPASSPLESGWPSTKTWPVQARGERERAARARALTRRGVRIMVRGGRATGVPGERVDLEGI